MSARTRTRRDFLRLLGIGATAPLSTSFATSRPTANRPDIVLIMVDDMGYSDIGCYGGEIRTPNLDKLAANGLRFTQFYNTARCCPTRASLMTGLYSHRAGVGHMTADRGHDGYRGDLNTECVTIAEALKPAGYGTYMTGKWHVTKKKTAATEADKHNWPCNRGFDRYFGTIWGAGSFWTPKTLTRDNTTAEEYPEDFFYTDAINDRAATFITEHHASRPNDPLFIYVAHTAPHWPLHARKRDIDKYRGTYMKGWDALRKERHARMIKMGIVRKDWPMTPRDSRVTPWKDVPEDRKRNMDWRMAVYAAQIDGVDQGIGRIVAALKKAGRLDNTLILFLADNGGCAEGGPWGFEQHKDGVLGTNSSFASYGLSWANASNTPFRRYKHWVHEGGISTPLIVYWPAAVSGKGDLCHQPGHLTDVMPTCLDVAGATYPTQHKGCAIAPLESVSLTPAFTGKTIQRKAIFWEHEGNRAVRRGKWKLVSKFAGDWELYDMEADRTELHDAIGKHPEIAREMQSMYDAWAERNRVVSWGTLTSKGSKAMTFDLKQGQTLERDEAPNIGGRSIAITATVTGGKDGVIVAQGGPSLGYALYVEDGKLAMATRCMNKLTVVAAKQKLPAGTVRIAATLGKDGTVTLSATGRMVAKGKTPGPIPKTPMDVLSAGFDYGNNVGEYKGDFTFAGKIDKLHIELGK